jgi:predicted helicase
MLAYCYAILHSRSYRLRHDSLLRSEYPRIPVPLTPPLGRELIERGLELMMLHVMESPKLDRFITTYIGPNNPEVVRVGWSDDTVWLDAAATKKGGPTKLGTNGFHGVPEDVWNFQIGGYQVCEKWLKDRKGRALSKADIAHYQKIVVALHETNRLMNEIDEIIEKHGGWPAAFG